MKTLGLVLCASLIGCSATTPVDSDGGSVATGRGDAGQPDAGNSFDAGGAVDGGHPNILLVIADDMGIDVSPCYAVGASNVRPAIPNLSARCASGVVFENFWAAPECSPTRARLLTGRFSFRTQVGSAGDALATTWSSLQQVLKPTYTNAIIGKWHLGGGMVNISQPRALGVDFYQGLWTGALPNYSNWTQTQSGGAQVARTEYATTVFSDDAIAWLSARSTPWFLWLAYTAPHTPFHLPPAGLHTSNTALSGTAADIANQPLPYYNAALEALDHELGRVLGSLSPAQRQNTVVIFMGDNGTPLQVAQSPYTRATAKGSLNAGGIHVPLVISGAGVTRVGTRVSALVQVEDLMATIADLGGVSVSAVDGTSFKAALIGAAVVGRPVGHSEFFRGNGNSANDNPAAFGWTVRNEKHQLIRYDTSARRVLFDLSVDPAGRTDLLAGTPSSETLRVADDLEDAGVMIRR